MKITATSTKHVVTYEHWCIELTIDGDKVRETAHKQCEKAFSAMADVDGEIERLRSLDGKPKWGLASKANASGTHSVYTNRYQIIKVATITERETYYAL